MCVFGMTDDDDDDDDGQDENGSEGKDDHKI